MPGKIEVYIDRIVLESDGHMNMAELNMAIREQLTAMISDGGLPSGLLSDSYHGRLNGGHISIADRMKSKNAGNAIARGIYHSFNRNG